MDDKILFWTAFGAIGTTLGSFATAIAVIVALWQTKYSTKKKLKLVFNDNIKIYNSVTS
ncbi:MAG: iron-containing alcohol dehydrogenase [Erysipelotrichaceae bacterium]|nr:iron-containing alcohol dehydrogenase [Erysipelotrichaceae bacterium]